MALRLHAWSSCVELRWSWEGRPEGEPVLWRDEHSARLRLAQLAALPGADSGLRRFLREGAPARGADVEDRELIEQLANAVAAGRIRIAEVRDLGLTTWGDTPAEEPASEPLAAVAPAPEPAPPQEEICWPCLRAAASARALREAAAQGAPFVVQD